MMTQKIYYRNVERRLQREANIVMGIPLIFLIALIAAIAYMMVVVSPKEKTPIDYGKHLLNEESDNGRKRTLPNLS